MQDAMRFVASEQPVSLYQAYFAGGMQLFFLRRNLYIARLTAGKCSAEVGMFYVEALTDLERISDHALNLQKSAQEMNEKNLSFSKEANAELATIASAVKSILNITYESFESGNYEIANQVEPLEQVIDNLKEEIRKRHIDRLKNGLCTIELGFILSDILSNYGRVSDHCSNIAVCMIQIKDDALDTHVYLNEVKTSDANFSKKFDEYKSEYKLPGNQI